jgi:hypothetical protein
MAERVKHILFLTSNNLSTNPRCLKEIRLALKNGYKVTLLAFQFKNWSAESENELRQDLPGVSFHYIPVDQTNLAEWFISGCITIMSRLLCRLSMNSTAMNSYAFDRRSYLALAFLRKNKIIANLIIAHNPGMFYPAMKYASEMQLPYAIDMEDYHPGEKTTPFRQQLVTQLTKTTVPAAKYVSHASTLIKKYTEELTGRKNELDVTVHNSFPEGDFEGAVKVNEEKPQLIWFSQHINYNRGLERYLPYFDQFSSFIRITLIGASCHEFYAKELAHRTYIEVMNPMKPEELNRRVCYFDIGLALEDVHADLNRNICLTNKILTYYQAGLYILATKTEAQQQFIAQHPEAGTLIDEMNLKDIMNWLCNNISDLRQNRQKRFENARNASWEKESVKINNNWKTLLAEA